MENTIEKVSEKKEIKQIEEIQEIQEMNEMEKNAKNLELVINHHYLRTALLQILDMSIKKSKELVDMIESYESIEVQRPDIIYIKNAKVKKAHERFRKTSQELIDGFTNTNSDSDFDQGKIIKKIYKTVTQYLDKLLAEPNSDITMFSERNSDGKIVTIIPGLDLNLVVKHFSEEELTMFWGYFYVVYISAVKMITEINSHKKNSKVWEAIPKIQERIQKLGLTSGKDSKLFNPYVGLTGDTATDINSLFSNVGGGIINDPSAMTPEGLLAKLGIENMLDLEKIKDQLNNIKEEDKQEAVKNIVNLLGANGDSDITDICSQLVGGIVEELKTNGLKDMFSTAQAVTSKLGQNLDKNKMKKTAKQLGSFVKNGQSNLKNLKDSNGNPLPSGLINNLSLPMNLLNNFIPKNEEE